jgi:hypothetical protein
MPCQEHTDDNVAERVVFLSQLVDSLSGILSSNVSLKAMWKSHLLCLVATSADIGELCISPRPFPFPNLLYLSFVAEWPEVPEKLLYAICTKLLLPLVVWCRNCLLEVFAPHTRSSQKISFNKLDTLRKTKISVIRLARHGPHRWYRFPPTVLNGVGNCPAEDDPKDSDFIAHCYVEMCILQRPSR